MGKPRRKKEPKYRIIEYPYWKALREASPALSGSQYGILLKMADETFGYREDKKPKSLSCQVSHIDFQEATKLDKRQVIRAIQAVEKRHIINADRSNGTRGTVYTWNNPEQWQIIHSVNHNPTSDTGDTSQEVSTSDTKDTSTSDIGDTKTSDTGGTKLVTLPRLQLTHKGKKVNKVNSKVEDTPPPESSGSTFKVTPESSNPPTQEQIDEIYRLTKSLGIPREDAIKYMEITFSKESTKRLTKDEADKFIKDLREHDPDKQFIGIGKVPLHDEPIPTTTTIETKTEADRIEAFLHTNGVSSVKAISQGTGIAYSNVIMNLSKGKGKRFINPKRGYWNIPTGSLPPESSQDGLEINPGAPEPVGSQ